MEEKFNFIEKEDLRKQVNDLEDKNKQYLENHPEVKEILNDFISSVLLHTPKDIFVFAQEYFSHFKKK